MQLTSTLQAGAVHSTTASQTATTTAMQQRSRKLQTCHLMWFHSELTAFLLADLLCAVHQYSERAKAYKWAKGCRKQTTERRNQKHKQNKTPETQPRRKAAAATCLAKAHIEDLVVSQLQNCPHLCRKPPVTAFTGGVRSSTLRTWMLPSRLLCRLATPLLRSRCNDSAECVTNSYGLNLWEAR